MNVNCAPLAEGERKYIALGSTHSGFGEKSTHGNVHSGIFKISTNADFAADQQMTHNMDRKPSACHCGGGNLMEGSFCFWPVPASSDAGI